MQAPLARLTLLALTTALTLPGLNLERAASAMDYDWSLLRRVLISFRRDFAQAPEQLADALNQGQFEAALRLAAQQFDRAGEHDDELVASVDRFGDHAGEVGGLA